MGQRRHHHKSRINRRNAAPAPTIVRPPIAAIEKKQAITYGKPFTLLEDTQKNAFIYNGGRWIAYEKTIAECRVDCQVKELSQKINGMTRYEVRVPL